MSLSLDPVMAFYVAPLLAIWSVYILRRGRAQTRAVAQRAEAVNAGLGQPNSLHPVFDASLCIGCKACLNACPEGDILGLIGNKAQLIEPSNCIGHGACKTACPRGAISLVFGTAERGVDLPFVGPDFQTNVPGIYIAGELGGMGLIRNAVEQGVQAMEQIAARPRSQRPDTLDVLIVGSGPAGIAASLSAVEHQLRYVTVEQDSLGGTVAHFPRGKVVMTAPVELPIIGQVKFKEIGKEELLGFWKSVVRKAGLRINYQERVESINAFDGGFAVQTTRTSYRTKRILLAIGRRGTPRRLEVPGEELPKVLYRLVDPGQFRGKNVLVVGGGDSALEAAASLAEQPGTRVTLSYRNDAFGRAKTKNRARIDDAKAARRLEVLLKSKVSQITVDSVAIIRDGRTLVRPNDAVIVCAGGILPTDFLRGIGIEIETRYGTA